MRSENKNLYLYPIDYPFETLVDRLEKGKLILNPDYQRKYKWDKEGEERTSKFIESCIMRIPIPACYFSVNAKGGHDVIDGVQRITTVKRFMNDEFALEKLTIYKELNGKRYSELPFSIQQSLEAYTIRCIVLTEENSKEMVREIFARLNQGAVQLSAQEIRHAIYPGYFNTMLSELATLPIIANFGKGKSGKKENDAREGEELVLRFFAFQENPELEGYEDNLKEFLDETMEKLAELDKEIVAEKKSLFEQTLEKCELVFGDEAFKDMNKERPQESRTRYDLIMYSFVNHSKEKLERKQSEIKAAFRTYCANEDTQRHMQGRTASKTKILARRALWEHYLNEVLQA